MRSVIPGVVVAVLVVVVVVVECSSWGPPREGLAWIGVGLFLLGPERQQ